MLRLVRYCFWLFARVVLPLRYRVLVHGWEKLDGLAGPILILPNHPAFVDPALVLALLWPRLDPRPLLFSGNFDSPFLLPVKKLVDPLELPDTDKPGRRVRKQTEEALRKLVAGLKGGRNHIMWPSGRLYRKAEESLGSARGLGDIIRDCPEATILLVRTTGLWGSMFSYARTGQRPHLVGTLLRGIGYLLANLIFFMPRRRVDITLEVLDRSKLPDDSDRRAFNRWFEDWYNQGGKQVPTWVPHHFLYDLFGAFTYGSRDFAWPTPAVAGGLDLGKVKPAMRDEVNTILARQLKRELSETELQPGVTLDSLGLDSLSRAALKLRIEQRFGFSGDEVPMTVGDLWALAGGLARKSEPKPTPARWFRQPATQEPVAFLGESIPEAFVARALSCRKDVAVADDLAGVLTCERLLVGALTLAKRLEKLPGTNVGLLLPASAGCDVLFLALQLAGKVPVVLNWTTGQGNLEHAARLLGLKNVVTSDPFLDLLDLPDLPGVEWTYLEALREDVGTWEILTTLLRVRWRPESVRQATPRPAPEQPAVVLFTSGSEKAPKAVSLTHRNLLTNLRGAVETLKPARSGSVLGFLPMFHSFGLTVTGLLPLLGGLRVVRHADPTDACGLARKVGSYGVTMMAATPTFLRYILDSAEEGQLQTLELIVVGAEKCPEKVFEDSARKAPRAKVLEGYGITECSPVVSVNPPEAPRRGTVGKPLPGVEVSVVRIEEDGHPIPEDVLPTNNQGMLLVSGPSVFPGYVGQDNPSPFVERDGKRWYVTGDLVEMDADGYIHFKGRLKRFIKVGGEMISLPELEAPLAEKYPPSERIGWQVAVEGVELEHGHKIALFTTIPLTLEEANDLLEQKGLRGVKRLTEVRRVQSIPMTGPKPDYKVLRAQLLEPAALAVAAHE
jgi:long-chain-fatty-acid--[acyl-carrier-protein] ligase